MKPAPYSQCGLIGQRRGLSWLQEAGIGAILDHHALPGVQTPGQQFTGKYVIQLLNEFIKAKTTVVAPLTFSFMSVLEMHILCDLTTSLLDTIQLSPRIDLDCCDDIAGTSRSRLRQCFRH